MKLYWKKLTGFEDLQREKIKLLYQRRHLDKLHAGHETGHESGKPADPGIINTILDLAGGGSSGVYAIEIGSLLMKQLGKKRRKSRAMLRDAAEFPKHKSTARKIFDDIFWSYVVGKAIRVSAGMLKGELKKKKSQLRK